MLELAPTAHSVRVARRFACEFLAGYDAIVCETVALLVSELVTNAVLHGGPHHPASIVGLALAALPDRIRVEVADAGAGIPRIEARALDYPSGRGLLLVQSMASRWGCDRSETGKTVWFELVTPSGGATNG